MQINVTFDSLKELDEFIVTLATRSGLPDAIIAVAARAGAADLAPLADDAPRVTPGPAKPTLQEEMKARAEEVAPTKPKRTRRTKAQIAEAKAAAAEAAQVSAAVENAGREATPQPDIPAPTADDPAPDLDRTKAPPEAYSQGAMDEFMAQNGGPALIERMKKAGISPTRRLIDLEGNAQWAFLDALAS